MPIDTQGWIEISRLDDSELAEEYAWQALLNIAAYVDAVDEVTEILFGYSKRILRGEHHLTAVAKDRGLPRNVSDQVKQQLEWIQEYEIEVGEREFFGYTYIYFHEIEQIHWQHDELTDQDSDWFRLFSLLDKLLEDHRFKAHKMRLIVWFNS